MSRYYASGDEHLHQPVLWWRGHPIWAAYFIVCVFVASLFASVLLTALHVGGLLNWLPFDNGLVWHGQVWRIFSYGLVNDASFRFALDMVYLAWFGREVERIFGQRKFLFLFAVVYLLPPILATPLAPAVHVMRAGETGGLAVFVAFATYFPDVEVFFHLTAKWCAWILVGIFTLMWLQVADWVGLAWLWLVCGFAYQWVRYEKGLFALPDFRFWKRTPKLRVLPDLTPEEKASFAAQPAPPDSNMAEIDVLLDKIAKSGLASLTAKERAKLEKGRENILRRESGRK